jgi:hypothetical protein
MEDYKDYNPPDRSCDGCTACCEGWLSAEALGKSFFPGQPCHWKGTKGCTVYEARPSVCSNFKCAWITNHFLPEWFKPTESNVIAVWRRWKEEDACTPENRGGVYLCVTECGEPISSNAMTWINNYVTAKALNVRYQHKGRWHWLGDEEFAEWCMEGAAVIKGTTKPQ